jgi:ATP-dependent exoDNAse (exonuclease V) alpha subunit
VGKKCLIIDEMSMLHDTLLIDVAKVIAHIKKNANEGDEHLPFAGMHVILTGDFHQFPPVARGNAALYSLSPTNNADALHGRNLYKQFNKIIVLHQQIRIKDPTWMNILSRLRVGQCTKEDIAIIRSLILNRPECPKTDFNRLPWSEATLITTRHTVREAWNAASIKRHCRNTGNIRYIVPSEDVINGTKNPLPSNLRYHVAGMKEKATGKLPDRIELAIGMKAMILVNLSTEAEIANGTRGTISNIILDPREEALKINSDFSVNLQYPPAAILFEPEGGSRVSSAFVDPRNLHSIAVPKGQIPITPITKTFTVIQKDGSRVTIVRRQYAMTGGYAFTDIKSQGQTMGTVVIDLRDTPTGKMSPFTAYVVLSRSRGRDTIRLLSDFDETLFQRHPNADLALEMERLQAMARQSHI